MDRREALEKVSAYARLVKKYFPDGRIYLFGSYAKGTGRADSDIDVAVVVKEITGDFFATRPLLWRLRTEIDDRIEPVLLEDDEDVSGFLAEIKQSGIRVA